MSFDLYDAWYLVTGFLMANGIPHFVFGRAGKVFRSPFGQRSEPRVNVLWGSANLIMATIISAVLAALSLFDTYSLVFLILGFWLVVLMFGTSMKRFLND